VRTAGGKAPDQMAGAMAMLKEGASLKRLLEEYPGMVIRYSRGLTMVKRLYTQPRDFKSLVILFIGPPGKGKTQVMDLLAPLMGTVYRAPAAKGSGCYFDDYDGQDVFIMDEFDGASMKPTFFNVLCDKYECVLPVHGGAGHQMRSRYIFIGSNYMPSQWWKGRNATQHMQTTRRIDIVFKMGFKRSEFENLKSAPKNLAPLFLDHPGSKAPQAPSGSKFAHPASCDCFSCRKKFPTVEEQFEEFEVNGVLY